MSGSAKRKDSKCAIRRPLSFLYNVYRVDYSHSMVAGGLEEMS